MSEISAATGNPKTKSKKNMGQTLPENNTKLFRKKF